MEKTFKLFSSCLPVAGAKRFVICDLQRSQIFFIPEGLFEILTEHRNVPVSRVKEIYNNEVDDTIDKYLDDLIQNELGFLTATPENFPDLNIEWDTPQRISNAIIESNSTSNHLFKDIFDQLEGLGCKFVELRFYDELLPEELIAILESTNERKFRGVNLVVRRTGDFRQFDMNHLLIRFQRIGTVLFHSCSLDEIEKNGLDPRIKFTTDVIENNECCGQVHSKYFSINMEMFMESNFHNSCLNKKLAITPSGEVKNCPSMGKTFGNVKQASLEEIVTSESFDKLWNITKDVVQICKDCEFRYICTDCRAFLSNPLDILSKPLKCGYDPYSATWKS